MYTNDFQKMTHSHFIRNAREIRIEKERETRNFRVVFYGVGDDDTAARYFDRTLSLMSTNEKKRNKLDKNYSLYFDNFTARRKEKIKKAKTTK